MKALITGGAGFIGSHLVSALLAVGVAVDVFDRRAGVAETRAGAGAIPADINDGHALRAALEGVDVVYHLAWSGVHESSNRDVQRHVEANLRPTLQLIELCRESGVRRLVFLSSGGAIYGPTRVVPIDESHPTQPLSAYGVTKLAAEAYLELHGRLHGFDYVILRPSVPYGERQDTASQGVLSVFLRKMLRGEPLTVFGDGSSTRDYFYAGDLAEACVLAANPAVERGVYNIGGGVGITLLDLVRSLENVTGMTAMLQFAPARAFDPASVVLDITKARLALGWEPKIDLVTGVERTWEWTRRSQSAPTGTV